VIPQMRTRRRIVETHDVQHYWPSFADMMTTVVLVMVFLAVIAYVQSIYDSYEQVSISEEIEKVGRVKEEITDSLQLELEKIVGRDQVSRGPNNTISMDGNILFPSASAEISEEGRKVLNQFSHAFQQILENEEYRHYIYIILIEGHTDKIPFDNWKLSTDRAVAVVKGLFEENPVLGQKEYAKYFAATGYSEFHPVTEGNHSSDLQKNRRISIQIILDDAKWQGELKRLIEQ
jgi:chemotaxis protein MotB